MSSVTSVDRYGKADSLARRNDCRIDSYYFSRHIEQRASGVAWINGCVGLDEVIVRSQADKAPFAAHNSHGYGPSEAKGVSYGQDPFSHLDSSKSPLSLLFAGHTAD